METVLKDLRYGFRNLKARPTFSFIAIFTLALGIGVTTSMITLVNNVLLSPLAFPNSHELVWLSTFNKKQASDNSSFSIAMYEQFKQVDSPLQDIAFWAYDQATLSKGDLQKPLTMLIGSANYFDVFQIKPVLGRVFDDSDVNTNVVVMSYPTWVDDFQQDPNILSRIVKINGEDFRVLGVMPEGFSISGYLGTDLWFPIDKLDRPGILTGRLKSGMSIEQAEKQSQAFQEIINQVAGDSSNIWEIRYTSILDRMVKGTRPALYLLLASVVAVFLIAVLNVINLTFAQYANRTQELAVRVSLGASRQRLMKQLLTESTLLCVVGGALGLLMAAWGLEWIRYFMEARLPRLHEATLDLSTLVTVFSLIVFSATATALIPAFTIVNPKKLADSIKEAGRKVTGDRQSQKVRRFLVACEVSVAVILLIGAGLLLRSYAHLANQPTGFNPEKVMTGHIWLPGEYQPTPNQAAFWQRSVDKLLENPKVLKAAATSTMPMSRTGIDYPVNYSYPGAPQVPRGEEPSASVRSITSGYFDLLDIPILEGRDFGYQDTGTSPRVVIINKKFAEEVWPNESAIGKTLTFPNGFRGEYRVVGVVGNIKHRGLRANYTKEFFFPMIQNNYPGMTFLVKTDSDNQAEVANLMRLNAAQVEPLAPMIMIESLAELTRDSIASERLLLTILAIFAGIALLLASIGVYGVSDNMVSQRTNEIGIRMAIGARPKVIRNWIVFDTAKPVLAGALVGLLSALFFGGLLASLLYGVTIWDPITYLAVPAILLSVGLLATWIPATRATKVHPQVALHYE